MSALHVIDVHPFIYAAQSIPSLASETSRGCPVGGIKLLTRKITNLIKLGDSVVCCFDSKTMKSAKFPEYKKGRKKVPEVILQCQALYKFLSSAGVCCLKINGLEADDIIYNVVNKSLNDYSQIFIYSSDYDLCHNLMDPKVCLRPATQNSLCVSFNNFTSVISSIYDCDIPYNMITAYKVFCGDKSDGIKAFVSESGVKGSQLFRQLVDFSFQNGSLPINVLRSRGLVSKLSPFLGLSAGDLETIEKRCDLFFPIEQDIEFFPTNIRSINMSYYKKFVRTIGDKDSCRALNCWNESSPEIEQEVFDFGNSYKSGEFHVDNNLSLEELEIKTSSVFIRGI